MFDQVIGLTVCLAPCPSLSSLNPALERMCPCIRMTTTRTEMTTSVVTYVFGLDLSSISCFLTLVANDVCNPLPLSAMQIYSPDVFRWAPRDDS
jgi:hypothetical protein